jgi:hypothetical protein
MDKNIMTPAVIYEKETGESSQTAIAHGMYAASPAYVKWLEANVILGEFDAHVICCNDSVIRVIIGNLEKAEKIKDEMSKANYDASNHTCNKDFDNYHDYQHRMFWHIHTVKGALK